MKDKNNDYRRSRLYIIETAVIFALFTLKLAFFYDFIGIGAFTAALTAATDLIVFGVYWLIMRFSRRSPMLYLKIVYCVLSVIMCIDRVYFSYIQRLPSWSALQMAGQLTDISSMVATLVTFSHALYVLDLPLWLIFTADFRRKAYDALKNGAFAASGKVYRRVSAAALGVCAAVIAIAFAGGNFRVSYLKNEIITYHTSDAVSLLADAVASGADGSQYIQTMADGGELYGVAQGRNVIMIQVEALQAFAVGLEYNGQSLTPNLDALIEGDTINFSNHYYQVGGGNTADAEFTVLNSLFAPTDTAAYIKYQDNTFYGLPWLLKDNGYSTASVFHGYKGEFWNREAAYPAQGFDDYISMEDFELDDVFGLGLSDVSFFRQSAAIMSEYEEPFFSFLITLSSHYPYEIPEEYKTLTLLSEHEGTLFGNYLQSVRYFDSALGIFLDELKAKGLYDDSIFIIYGDHYAIPSADSVCYGVMSELLGHNYFEDDIFKIPLIIHIPGSDVHMDISTVNGHVDVLPTLLYLMGIENDKSVMFGTNMITAESNTVCEMMHMGDGSYISDDVIFSMPASGILYNAIAFDRHTGERLNIDDYIGASNDCKKLLEDCASILDSNTVVGGK